MVKYPAQPIPPNPILQHVDPKTGSLTTAGMQQQQQMWAMVANTTQLTPCTATFNSNLYALTPFPSKATPTAQAGQTNTYFDYMGFVFVAPAASTGLVTANYNGFGAVKVFKQAGSLQATNGDFVNGGLYLLFSNSALDSGSGGLVRIGGETTGVYAVASLPTAGVQGRRAFVTDSNTSTFNATVAGGGANIVPVFDNGAVWKVG